MDNKKRTHEEGGMERKEHTNQNVHNEKKGTKAESSDQGGEGHRHSGAECGCKYF